MIFQKFKKILEFQYWKEDCVQNLTKKGKLQTRNLTEDWKLTRLTLSIRKQTNKKCSTSH